MNLVVYKSWLAISQKVINHTKNSKNINPFSSRFIWQTPILNLLNLCGMFSAETCQILLDATVSDTLKANLPRFIAEETKVQALKKVAGDLFSK